MAAQSDRRAFPLGAITLLLLALFFGASLQGQQQRFQQYGTADGLANLNVHALLQDRTGFLWVGTDNGLFRYDGARFQEYGHGHGLPSTEVHAIGQSSRSEALWVGTSAGLARFDDAAHPSHAVSWPALNFGDIRQITFDVAGNMYLLRHSEIVACATSEDREPHCQVAVKGEVHGLLLQGTSLILSRGKELWLKNKNAPEALLDTPSLPQDEWQALAEDKAGNLWVRSNTQLFERLAGKAVFTDRTEGLEHNLEPQLAVDNLGHVFVSTLSGAVAFDARGRTVLSAGTEASDDAVGPLLVDREGNLWLGMTGGGLLRRLGQGQWVGWKRENGLLNNSVWAIQHMRDGSLWVGTSAGLTLFGADGKLRSSVTTRDGLPADRVVSMQPAATGDVFVGTDPKGLSQFSSSGKLLRVYSETVGLHGRMLAITLDQDNRLWLATSGGVYCSQALRTAGQQLRFRRVAVPNMTSEAVFRDILVTKHGSIWIASSQGVALFSKGEWRTFKTSDGLASDDIDVITEHDDVLWVGYRDALGLGRFDVRRGQFSGELITKKDGLSSDVIYSLGVDHAGSVWACSDRGVDVLEGGHWRHFDSSNGLIWNDTNSRALNIDETGEVWIGTSEGMSRFSPNPEQAKAQVTNAAITAVQSGDHQWLTEQEPVLPYAQREINIRFASLSFANPLSSFRYRLSGYSHGWVETQSHSVQFEALPAGHYLFEVEARSADGSWDAVSTRFQFQVLAPWWQRWYWIAGYVATMSLILVALWHLRERALIKQKEYLQAVVNQQTNELRESYSRLEAIAYLDQLTSLPNRRKFSEELRHRLSLDSPMILLLIDLDRFKEINDEYGHDAGDAVLVQTAIRLLSAAGETALVARLGGDEFAILLEAATTDADEVERICRRVLKACSAPIGFRKVELEVGCSIGVAISDDLHATEASLYKAADLALYQVKRGGRNGFSLSQHKHDSFSVENDRSKLSAMPVPQ